MHINAWVSLVVFTKNSLVSWLTQAASKLCFCSPHPPLSTDRLNLVTTRSIHLELDATLGLLLLENLCYQFLRCTRGPQGRMTQASLTWFQIRKQQKPRRVKGPTQGYIAGKWQAQNNSELLAHKKICIFRGQARDSMVEIQPTPEKLFERVTQGMN